MSSDLRSHARRPMIDPTFTPTGVITLKLGDRVYEVAPFLMEGETDIWGQTMMDRAKEFGGDVGKEDRAWFIEYQTTIPPELQGEIYFLFPKLNFGDYVEYAKWERKRLVAAQRNINNRWHGNGRLVRRVE